jgi:hypothetical protein
MSPMPGEGHTVAKSFSNPVSIPGGQFGSGAVAAGAGCPARPPRGRTAVGKPEMDIHGKNTDMK